MIKHLFTQIQDRKYFILLLKTVLQFLLELLRIHFSPCINSVHHLPNLLYKYCQHQIAILLNIFYYRVLLDFIYSVIQYLIQQHFTIHLQLQKILLLIQIFNGVLDKSLSLRILLIPYDLNINQQLKMPLQIPPLHWWTIDFDLLLHYFYYLKYFFEMLMILRQ